jgi:hypothetical protein
VYGTFVRNAPFKRQLFSFYISLFIFYLEQGEVEGHFPSMVTIWWQCQSQIPNGNDKVGS